MQSGWTIPDAALRANMKDAIIDDFLPAYKVCHGMLLALGFPKNAREAE